MNAKHILGLALVISSLLLTSESFAARDFDFDDVVSLVQNQSNPSVETTLPLLPEEMRSSYTLVYQSQSSQGASASHPRAIMFGNNAKLIMTFNGDSSQRNFNRLEIIQFKDETKEFEFRTITFENGSAKISNPNPAECLACHGANPRPIWQSYHSWPGVFGSNDDYIDSTEVALFQSYTDIANSDPRYSALIRRTNFFNGQGNFPYRGPALFGGDITEEHRFRPNDRLGKFLVHLNGQRIAARIEKSDFFKNHQATIAAWFAYCNPTKQEQAKLSAGLAGQLSVQFPVSQYPALYLDLKNSSEQMADHFMLEKILTGLDTYDWYLGIENQNEAGTYDMNSGFLTSRDWATPRLLDFLAPTDADVSSHYAPISYAIKYNDENNNAGDLAAKNLSPGGIIDQYDSDGLYYDENAMNQACPALLARMDVELAH